MANFCKHELSAELELCQLTEKRQQVSLLLGVWRDRAHAKVPMYRHDNGSRGIDHASACIYMFQHCAEVNYVSVDVNSPSR